MSRIPIFLCLLVLATTVFCEDPPSTKSPEHQNKEHPKQTGSVGNPPEHPHPEQHHKMADLPKGQDNNQMPKFNQNNN